MSVDPTVSPSRHDLDGRDDLELLVREFYRAVAMDDLLGPPFEAARADWHAHIATLVDFWAWQMFGEPGYSGHPLLAHRPVHERTPLGPSHYRRWIGLFAETVDEHFSGDIAEAIKTRARKMAAAMARLLGSDDSSRSVAG